MTTGTELSQAGAKIFKRLPQWLFYTMNSRRATPSGMVGFPDHTAIFFAGIPFVAFIEVKGEGDTMSAEQKEFAIAMRALCKATRRFVYMLLEDERQWDIVLLYDVLGDEGNFYCNAKLEPPTVAGDRKVIGEITP